MSSEPYIAYNGAAKIMEITIFTATL